MRFSLDCIFVFGKNLFAKKSLITIFALLLPFVVSASVRKFVVSNTSFGDNLTKSSVEGSLAAAVDSVNKYSTDSCVINFALNPDDTVIVDTYTEALISNKTYTLLDGGKSKVKIKSYNSNFGFKNAQHVVVKNIDFSRSVSYGLYVYDSQIDSVYNCFFDNISTSSTGAITGLGTSTFDCIRNCEFSGKEQAIFLQNGVTAHINHCDFHELTLGVLANSGVNVSVTDCSFDHVSEVFRSYYGMVSHCTFTQCGVVSYSGNSTIVDCKLTGCKKGMYSAKIIRDCVFVGNGTSVEASYTIDSIVGCTFTRDTAAIVVKAIVNNVIGNTISECMNDGIKVTSSVKHIYDNLIEGNDVGINMNGRFAIDSISRNVIVDNKKEGVLVTSSGSTFGVWTDNYIGTNSKWEKKGNGGDGVRFVSQNTYPKLFKNNYIGNNKGAGFSIEGGTNPSMTIEQCYIGVTPDSSPMPNGKDGICISSNGSSITLSESKIGNNGGAGLRKSNYGTLVVKDCSFYSNGGYGITMDSKTTPTSLTVEESVFDSNDSSAISTKMPNNFNSRISQTLFLNTQEKVQGNLAIENAFVNYVPVITSVSAARKGEFVVNGKVDTAGKVFVELFLSSGDQTATRFIASDSTAVDGTFSIPVKFSCTEGALVATASYKFGTNSSCTSELSDSYDFNFCKDPIEVIMSDSIIVGESLRGVVYDKVGVFRSEDTLVSVMGCDSVVSYTLFVMPDSIVRNYYVKTKRVGLGDGSSWENAMNGDDFAEYLPLVPDGVTFYVAEGRYMPIDSYSVFDGSANKEYKGYTINSSVSIMGGFAPNAETGAVADPRKYKTVFTGDPSGDDYYNDEVQQYLEDPSGDDIPVSTLFVAKVSAELHITGCELSGTAYQYPNLSHGLGNPISCDSLYLSNCTFDKTGTIGAGEKMWADSCVFRNRSTYSSPSSAFAVNDLYVTNSIFENGEGSSGGCFGRVSNLIDARNSVFYNMVNSGSLFDSRELYLYNNLFVNISATGLSEKLFAIRNSAEIVGNMFKDCRYDAVANSTESAIIKHNLCENIKGTENDIQTDDLSDDIVDCVYNETTGTATPKFTDWGGYVPTVITKSDKLSDGTSIRFPLEETKVESDQRGVKRLSNTCIGIYEIPCSSDTIAADTFIYVGESFEEKHYDEIGVYDSIFVTLVATDGCDSVVNYTLKVKESPLIVTTVNNFGDGSLPEAIAYANTMPDTVPAEIIFRFDEPGVKVISLDTTLTITKNNISINGNSSEDSIVIQGDERSFNGLVLSGCMENVSVTGLSFAGFSDALYFSGTANVSVDQCYFDDNHIGVHNVTSAVTVTNSTFTNNDKGYYSNYLWITDCKSPFRSVIKKNVFGLSKDQKTALPNNVGIYIAGTSSSTSGDHYLLIGENVISGNAEEGINVSSGFSNNSIRLIYSNLIGTNIYHDDFGNGTDGIYANVTSGTLYVGSSSLDSANVIGYNKGNGINAGSRNTIGILGNYIGMSKDFEPMPNGGCGVYGENTVMINGTYIGFNEKDGVYSTLRVEASNSFIGGDGEKEYGNKGYGINACTSYLLSNHIWNNKLGGVYKSCESQSYPGSYIRASQNLFGGTDQTIAIRDVNKDINIPVLSTVKVSQDSIVVSGHVDMLNPDNLVVGTPFYVDETSVTIELFSNEGLAETAYKYIGSLETDGNGDFRFAYALDDPKIVGQFCFTTTATHRFVEDYGIGDSYYTSQLSLPLCVNARDTILSSDTVCAGLSYEKNGWSIPGENLPSTGVAEFSRVVSSELGGASVELLTIRVMPVNSASLSHLAVQSPDCDDKPFGRLAYAFQQPNGSNWNVDVLDSNGNVVSSDRQGFTMSSYYRKLKKKLLFVNYPNVPSSQLVDSLAPGTYTIKLSSNDVCSVDSLYEVSIKGFEHPATLGKSDTTFYTICRNESQADYTTSISGYKSTMKIFFDEKDVKLSGNMELVEFERQDSAVISLKAIPVGDHVLKAQDACGEEYVLSNIHVLAPDSIQLTVSGHSEMPLKCSYDKLAYIDLTVEGGIQPQLFVSSEKFNKNYGAVEEIRLADYSVGSYRFVARTSVENCTDSSLLVFPVEGPSPLTIDLRTNAYGKFCEEGGYDLEATTSGESGNYTYVWSSPSTDEIKTSSNILKNVGPGSYICVVKDNEGCSEALDTATLSLDTELSRILIKKIKQSATCFDSPFAKISVSYSDNNAKQVVSCLLNDEQSGKLVKSATSKLQDGDLVLSDVPVGSYRLSVRYGTQDCILDTTKFADTSIVVSAKAEPLSIGTPVITPQSCVTKANGQVAIAVKGWDDYVARWDRRKTRPDSIVGSIAYFNMKRVAGGRHVFSVQDECGGSDSVVVEESQMPVLVPAVMSLSHVIDTVLCARDKSAQVAVNIQGGALGSGLIVFDGVPHTYDRESSLFTNLGKGVHTIEYRSPDEECEHDVLTKTFKVKGPDTLSVEFALSGIDCDAANLYVIAKGETAPYLFIWDENGKASAPSLFSTSPFAPQSDSVYGLTVKDAAGCDSMYTQFRVPNVDELPPLLIDLIPYPEKCYQGNNGSMDIWFSNGIYKLPFGMMVTVEMTKDGVPYKTFERAIQDQESYLIQLVDCLTPGSYEVTVRYGGKECQMSAHEVSQTAQVEALHPLNVTSTVDVTPQTCTRANGMAELDVDGWNDSHSVQIYYLYEIKLPFIGRVPYPVPVISNYSVSKKEQLAHLKLLSLKQGRYQVVISDVCGNKVSKVFKVDYVPTTIENVSSEQLTCLGKPNGVINFEVHGWTSSHGCELVKDDQRIETITPALPYRYDAESKIAHFRIDTLTAGDWRIWVSNECAESIMLDSLCNVKGISPYKITISDDSHIHLDCPYSEDGRVKLTVSGGIKPTAFTATREMTVMESQFAGYDIHVTERYDTVLVPHVVYDSTKCETIYDTTIVGAARDTVITSHLDCPIMIDSVTGAFVWDTSSYIRTFYDTTFVERYEQVPTTAFDTLQSDLYLVREYISFLGGFIKIPYYVTQYYAEELKAGTYHYTYRSAVEGCPDKVEADVTIDRPSPVTIISQTLDISCADSTDGQISLKPLRRYSLLPDHPKYVVGHNPERSYGINELYLYSSDSASTQYGTIAKHNHTLLTDENGDVITHRIDIVNDSSDFKSITWSYAKDVNDEWRSLDLVVPSSSDSTEQYYYDANGTRIRGAVYANFHLDDFWLDNNGEYQYADVQSIANLEAGYYAVTVYDSKACHYEDTIKVALPETALQITSIEFDEAAALCEPKDRQIRVEAKGGWGSYNYSFTDLNDPDESIGRKTEPYRGGEASGYDASTVSGWCVSKYLQPGDYTVFVIDEKGCIVKSDKRYKVRSNFELKADTVVAICPKDPLTASEVYFTEGASSGEYSLYRYVTNCPSDVLDTCMDKSFDLLSSSAPRLKDGKYLFDVNLPIGTNGLFIYENKENGCGTYVEATIIDTLIPMGITMKRDDISSLVSLCAESSDASAQFFVNGGTPAYSFVINTVWGEKDTMLIDGIPQVFNPKLEVRLDSSKTTLGEDTLIESHFITISDLTPGTYYFSIVDANGCVRPFGGDSVDSIVVRRAEPLTVDFKTSIICPATSITTGGSIFFNKASGGTAPYVFKYSYDNGEISECGPVQEIPNGELDKNIYMSMTDANGCTKDTITAFVKDPFVFEKIDFWASSKRYKGDVLALIDNCEPVEQLDSVVYTFTNPTTGEVDSRVQTLDRRMYIYDIESGLDKYRHALDSCPDTKNMVSDGFFANHFNLNVDPILAKHINFVRMNDTTGNWETSPNGDSVWVMHNVKMTAYFLGCAYETTYRELKINFDDIEIYNGGIGQRSEILSLNVYPNPCTDFEQSKLNAVFSSKMDADLFLYHMDGTSDLHYHVSKDDSRWSGGDGYDDPEITLSLKDLLDNGESSLNGKLSETVIVYLRTAHDAVGTYILVDPQLLNK